MYLAFGANRRSQLKFLGITKGSLQESDLAIGNRVNIDERNGVVKDLNLEGIAVDIDSR